MSLPVGSAKTKYMYFIFPKVLHRNVFYKFIFSSKVPTLIITYIEDAVPLYGYIIILCAAVAFVYLNDVLVILLFERGYSM